MEIKEYYNTDGFYLDDDSYEVRVARKAAAVMSIPRNGGSVLDIGCGTGGMFEDLLANGAYEITGLDISERMIREAENSLHDGRITLRNEDFMTFEDTGYDLAIAFNSYHHFQDPEAFAKKAYELLNRGGRLTVAHSFGKERTNAIARVMPEGVCRELLAPWGELKYWNQYFRVDCMCDNEQLYLMSGVKL